MPQCNSHFHIIAIKAFLSFSSYLQTRETTSLGNKQTIAERIIQRVDGCKLSSQNKYSTL